MALFDAPKKPSSPFADFRDNHGGVRVLNQQAAIGWYTNTLDFRPTAATEAVGLDWLFLSPPTDYSVSIELTSGPGARVRPGGDDLEESLKNQGWQHFCWRVDNIEATLAEMADGTPLPDGRISQGLFCNVCEFEGDLIRPVPIYVDPDFTSSDAAMLKTLRPAG